MEPFLILIPLMVVVITALWGATHSLLRTWLDYRIRMRLLDTFEKDPDRIREAETIRQLLDQFGRPANARRHNYLLTGILLLSIGVVCIAFGRTVRVGEIAVGTYLGGFLCVFFGLLLSAIGALIRAFRKDPSAAVASRG